MTSSGTATGCSTAEGAATMVHSLHSFVLTLALAAQVPRPDSSAWVVGQVRDDKGQPVVGALVEAMGLQINAWSNRQGRYELRGLPVGRVHVQMRFLGIEPVDTTLTLRRRERAVWNVVLHEPDWAGEAERAESARVAAGGLDSVGAG